MCHEFLPRLARYESQSQVERDRKKREKVETRWAKQNDQHEGRLTALEAAKKNDRRRLTTAETKVATLQAMQKCDRNFAKHTYLVTDETKTLVEELQERIHVL